MPVTAIVRAVARTGSNEVESVIEAPGADDCNPSRLDAVFDEIEARARQHAALGCRASMPMRAEPAAIARCPSPIDALALFCSHAAPLIAPVSSASAAQTPRDRSRGVATGAPATAHWRAGDEGAIRVAPSRVRREHRRVLN